MKVLLVRGRVLPVRGAMKVLPVRVRAMKVVPFRGRAMKVVLVRDRAMKMVMKVVRADEARRGRGAAGEEKRADAARGRGRDARGRSAARPPVVGLRPSGPCEHFGTRLGFDRRSCRRVFFKCFFVPVWKVPEFCSK
jgi:hypothetical protein